MILQALRRLSRRKTSSFSRSPHGSASSLTRSPGPWVLEPGRVIAPRDVGRLLASAQEARDQALVRRNSVAVRDCLLVELALASGLRLAELVGLTCADLALGEPAAVVVRHGKGSRSRVVMISSSLAGACRTFLAWKAEHGEPTGPTDPLFLSSVTGRALTDRALQLSFERSLQRAGVGHRGIHSCRHTYATALLKASGGNLRLVQRQLGHASLATTQIYLALFADEVKDAVEALYADVPGQEGDGA